MKSIHGVALVLVLLGVAFAQEPPPDENRPVVAGDHVIDPFKGEALEKIDGADPWSVFWPDAPGHYRTESGEIYSVERKWFERPTGSIELLARSVVLHPRSGERKEVELDATITGYRGPPCVITSDVVLVSTTHGLRALDPGSGVELWRTKEALSNLVVEHGLVVGVEHGALVESRLASGGEVFRATLPREWSVDAVSFVGSLVLVREGWPERAGARFYDEKGQLAFERKGWLEAFAQEKERLLLVGKEVSLVEKDGSVVWTNDALKASYQLDRVGRLPLEGGGHLLWTWHRISDSGVEIARIGADGKTVWKVAGAPLGTSHSKYRHEAYVELRGERFVVVSQGSHGCWTEARDLAKGELSKRWSSRDK